MASAALGGVLESIVEKGVEVGICVAPLLINGAVELYSDYTGRDGRDAMKVLSLVKGWAHGGRECFAGPCPSDKETFPPGPGYDVTKSSAIPPPFRSPSQPFRGHSAATRPDSSAYDGPMATWRQAPAGDFGRVRAPSPSDVSGRSRDQEKSEIPLDVSWEGQVMVEDICDRAYMPRGRATGVGDVFDARFRGQRVALKIAAGKSELSGSEIRSRMQNMSLLVERGCYKRCPSLVQFYGWADLGFSGPRVCLLMEWLPQTIESLLEPRSFWRLAKPPAAAPWLLAIAEGLKVLHDQSWAHGSLNPGKVLASSDGTIVKLGDFGMRYIVAEKRRDTNLSSETEAPSAGGTSEPVKASGVCEIECEEDEPDLAVDVIAFGRMMAYLEHRKCLGTDTKEYQDLKNVCLDAAEGPPLSIDTVLKLLQKCGVGSSKEMVDKDKSGSVIEKVGQNQDACPMDICT